MDRRKTGKGTIEYWGSIPTRGNPQTSRLRDWRNRRPRAYFEYTFAHGFHLGDHQRSEAGLIFVDQGTGCHDWAICVAERLRRILDRVLPGGSGALIHSEPSRTSSSLQFSG